MILVSACLVGVHCRYDGKASRNEALYHLYEQGQAIAICPEVLGGLPIPRNSCEQIKTESGIRVMTQTGEDWTEAFEKGAQASLAICQAAGITEAVLKAKSPSCGCGQVYDGTFSKVLIPGDGLTAGLLKANGIQVKTELDFPPVEKQSLKAFILKWSKHYKIELTAILYAMKHPQTPWYAKAMAAIVVGYAFSPIDLIPDFIPVLGYLDDAVLLPLGIALTLKLLPKHVIEQCREEAQKRPPDKGSHRLAAGMILLFWALVILWLISKFL